jgi:hypothetical protein
MIDMFNDSTTFQRFFLFGSGLQLYDIWKLQKRDLKVDNEDTLLTNIFNNMIYMTENEIFDAISKEK